MTMAISKTSSGDVLPAFAFNGDLHHKGRGRRNTARGGELETILPVQGSQELLMGQTREFVDQPTKTRRRHQQRILSLERSLTDIYRTPYLHPSAFSQPSILYSRKPHVQQPQLLLTSTFLVRLPSSLPGDI